MSQYSQPVQYFENCKPFLVFPYFQILQTKKTEFMKLKFALLFWTPSGDRECGPTFHGLVVTARNIRQFLNSFLNAFKRSSNQESVSRNRANASVGPAYLSAYSQVFRVYCKILNQNKNGPRLTHPPRARPSLSPPHTPTSSLLCLEDRSAFR